MILSKIIEEKRREVDKLRKKNNINELKKKAESLYIRSAFKKNISRKGHINLIAEVKKSSPSQGIICVNFDPIKTALTYQAAGASAISVLTDERFFDGKIEYLKMIKERVTLPVLRKDFIIDEYQIYESLIHGADAVLLISHILTQEELIRYLEIVKNLGMDAVIEVHNEEDVEKALASRALIIGINNRNLDDFSVDMTCTQRIIRLIPETKIIIAESGIKSYEEVMFLKSLGVNAVLIGTAFMSVENIADKVKELMREG